MYTPFFTLMYTPFFHFVDTPFFNLREGTPFFRKFNHLMRAVPGVFVLSSDLDVCSICFEGGGVIIQHIPDINSSGKHAVHLNCLEEWCTFNVKNNRGLTCPYCTLPCLKDVLISSRPSETLYVDTVMLLDKKESLIEIVTLCFSLLRHKVVQDLQDILIKQQMAHHRNKQKAFMNMLIFSQLTFILYLNL
jgi:hypothetical protein